jgi:hypothetical protein
VPKFKSFNFSVSIPRREFVERSFQKFKQDAKLARKIAITWTGEAEAGTIALSPEGSFEITRKSDTNIFAGTWLIKDGGLIMTLTNAPVINGHSLAGGVARCKIISMDAHKIVYSSGGRDVTLSR